MSERSTAASPSTGSDDAPADAETKKDAPSRDSVPPTGNPDRQDTPDEQESIELHSGHRLAARYRLEECITRLDGFSSWRAVDEKLRRAVGVHVLPAAHERAGAVLSAARSAALLSDPRFVQVLDADEHDGTVHVIHEWLPDADPLSTVLQHGPLEPHEAYALVTQLAQAMTAAHREGLAHLRLTPGTVLRTGAGQYRIRGLAVDATLRGITADHPERTDTEAIGALLYAALTQRWPYAEGAYGLAGVTGLSRSSRESLATPEQVRAGVHRGLSDLAMRALINDGATATSQEQPCTTPEELARAVAAIPRLKPPEPSTELLTGYQRTTYQQGTFGPQSFPGPNGLVAPPPAAPPALPGKTGAAIKWSVSALLIAALGLGSWQIADALLEGDAPVETSTQQQPESVDNDPDPVSEQVPINGIEDFDPFGGTGSQNPQSALNAIDGDPETFWPTKNYYGPGFGNLKPGLGLILDLGEPQQVGSVTIEALGTHDIEFHAAPSSTTTMPSGTDDFEFVTKGSGDSLTLTAEEAVDTRYVLVWITELPRGADGNYRGRIANITVSS
ncbi:protein kinase family protein [Streptomyces sp. ACA25]|uniref:protein kinase family protein n=1 Tax=Streptomyces sp. ACA25 TaxID=3022596 RepID=UPI00230755DD|nr:protein kinase family protein [Streptomyces sp. ACA25]MDB1086246.1 protein kinase family protein [Streptomyces sp. ACA25]